MKTEVEPYFSFPYVKLTARFKRPGERGNFTAFPVSEFFCPPLKRNFEGGGSHGTLLEFNLHAAIHGSRLSPVSAKFVSPFLCLAGVRRRVDMKLVWKRNKVFSEKRTMCSPKKKLRPKCVFPHIVPLWGKVANSAWWRNKFQSEMRKS